MPGKWHVLAIVGTGVFMCTLDSSIVNVSLPAIAAHFNVPVGAEVEWVIMGAAPRDRRGVAAGMLATGRTMGQSLSVAIAGAVFVGLGSAAAGRALLAHPHDPALSATFVHGYRWALLACAAISAAAIVTSLLRGREHVHSVSRSSPASGPVSSSRISPAT